MTHSLHREGSVKSLENDYVILITPAIGVNDKGSGEKLKRYLKILVEEGVENIGDVEHGSIKSGLTIEKLDSYLGDGKRIRAAISEKGSLKRILGRIKDEDMGLSITVSGLVDNIYEMSRELGIKPHSINMALGVWGKVGLLPEERIREITTMCGHHMVSSSLVKEAIKKVRDGKMTPEEASEKIGKLCVCGIFNTKRCRMLLEQG
jgi:hypothetical protein